MHIAILTSGGAGMFCGSCMHDNTLARGLRALGEEVTLIPTYTPIRVDEPDASEHHVYLGGIDLYLRHRWRLWRSLPRAATRWMDAPWLLRFATQFGVSNDARHLGELTLAMLSGSAGPQREALAELAQFIIHDLQPDIVVFSNTLLAGALEAIRVEQGEYLHCPVVCLLQGDDIFLDGLVAPYRDQALSRLRNLVRGFDGFLTHSHFYADHMSNYLDLPRKRLEFTPLGIDLAGHDGTPKESASSPFTVGYFARICPEKGLHRLVEAFRILHQRQPHTRLVAAGYLGARDRRWAEQLFREAADLGDAFTYLGSPATHDEKVAVLKSFDVLSVPTEYHEPKGLYVLEALANGVPVVQPRHGAFPELLDATGGGLLVEPNDAGELAAALERLILDPRLRLELSRAGHAAVHERFGLEPTASATRDTLQRIGLHSQ
jgi:glycosyltransferase involved in cell wall biosynthesis